MPMQWNSPEESNNWLLFFSLIHVPDLNCASLVFGPMPFTSAALRENFGAFSLIPTSTISRDRNIHTLGGIWASISWTSFGTQGQ